MQIDVFAGSRRLAVVIAVAWVTVCAVAAYFIPATATLSYAISSPGSAPVQTDHCEASDGRSSTSANNQYGRHVEVVLCFKPAGREFDASRIAYRELMDIKLPEGTIITGVPKGTTRSEFVARLASNGYDFSKLRGTSAMTTLVPEPIACSDPGQSYPLAGLDSPNVQQYMRRTAENFKIPAADSERL